MKSQVQPYRLGFQGLTGLAKARFDSQLVKTDRALIDHAGQLAKDDLLPTRLLDKVWKPKWTKPRRLMARPLPDHLLEQRELKWQQIGQRRAVRCPAGR